jgi:UDP-N-acetyl-D-mannosaminuronate dehydrogenase
VSREVNEAVPARAVRQLADLAGGLSGLRVAVLGAAYRSGVKETAFSGVFAIVRELALLGAVPLVHDPLYNDAELREIDLTPYHIGEPCDAVIIHTDHREYVMLRPEDLPGVRAMVDGRAITDASRWADIPRRVLGVGTALAQGG